MDEQIKELLNHLNPITLEEMSSIRLMNRIDSKFVTNKSTLVELLKLAQGSYYVQETNNKRISPYRTTYWDTDDYMYYVTHHNGHSPRRKVRVRTYVDSDLTFLEVKRKNNHGRTKKKRIGIEDHDDLCPMVSGDFLVDTAKMRLEDLHAALQNQFDRITLVNVDKTERLTIDFNVQFHNLDTTICCGTGNLVIVELKRDGNVYSPVKHMLLKLRVKPSGFSKYCIGTAMTNPGVKRNLFKERLRRINKYIK